MHSPEICRLTLGHSLKGKLKSTFMMHTHTCSERDAECGMVTFFSLL